MRVYIAGPMTGIPQYNIPAFDHMAASLRQAGFEVINPAELDDPATRAAALASPDGAPGSGSANGETWGMFLARDVLLIADGDKRGKIDAIVVLPGWQKSRGARLETFVGRMLCGKPVYRWDGYAQQLVPVRMLSLARGWLNKQDIAFDTPAEELAACERNGVS